MPDNKIDTVRLQNMSRSFITSASLFAAIDLDLFTAVSEGDDSPALFAKRSEISELNADRLMTMCAAAGLLNWEDGCYRNAEDVQRYLVRGEKAYAGAWLTFTRPGWKNWGELTEKLKTTIPPKVIGNYDEMTVERARRYHEATASVGFGSGRRFVRHVDLSGRARMMDLGGGSGAYSIVAAETWPELQAVVFDLPPVVEVTKDFIADRGVNDRVTVQAGDFTRDAFPERCDVAVMASNLPQYNREIIASVIAKAFDALLPGGEMHLIGEMLDDSRDGPLDAAIWGLMEALSNSTGIAHTRAECMSYFERAGFVDIAEHEFIPGVLARVSGSKPG
jgi:SAM-dependent methyltransferase